MAALQLVCLSYPIILTLEHWHFVIAVQTERMKWSKLVLYLFLDALSIRIMYLAPNRHRRIHFPMAGKS